MMKGKKILLTLIMFVACLMFGSTVEAESVKVDATNFPDQAIRNALDRYVDEEGYIDTDKITYFYISDDNGVVQDLTGIELLSSMTSLVIYNYNGGDVTIANPQLAELCIYSTPLQSISFDLQYVNRLTFFSSITKTITLKSPALTNLFIGGEGLTTLNGLEQLSKLKVFEYIEGSLTQFDVGAMPNLESLVIANTKVQEIKNLDKLKALESINVNSNKLKKLNLSANTKLTTVHCCYNALTSLKLPKSVQTVNAAENKLTTLNVSQCTQLKYLSVPDNKIKKIDLSKCKNLTTVELNGNKKLSTVNVSKNKKLGYLNVGYTSLKKLDVKKNTKLTALMCYKTKISTLNLKKNKKLSSISYYDSKIKKLDLTKYKTLAIDYEVKPGKSVSLKNYLGTGYEVDYASSELKYSKKNGTIKLSKEAQKGYMYYMNLKKGKKMYSIMIVAR